MNRIIALLFISSSLLIAGSSSLFAQTDGWVPQQSGTTARLLGVYFTDANTGTIVGDSGIILRTTNCGTTWVRQASGTTSPLQYVTFTDANTGFVSDGGDTLLHTTNGGTTWTSQTIGIQTYLHAIAFSNANTGWAVGEKLSPTYADDTVTIVKTTNGGAAWTQQLEIDTCNGFGSMCIVDTNTVIVLTASGALRTTDGGKDWVTLTSWHTGLYVRFFGRDTGIIVDGNGEVYHTTDAGANWAYNQGGAFGYAHGAFFVNPDTGYSSGEYVDQTDGTEITRTTNGGQWLVQRYLDSIYISSIFFVNADTGFAIGSNGVVFRTINGGVPPPNISVGQVIFPDLMCSDKEQDTTDVNVYNEGGDTLVISSSYLTPGNIPFTLLSPGMPVKIPPGSAVQYVLTFSPPDTGTYSAILHIASNDSAHTPLLIGLSARKDIVGFSIDSVVHDTLDFGSMKQPGVRKDTFFILRNTSSTAITFSLQTTDTLFYVNTYVTIPGGDSASVPVYFNAAAASGTHVVRLTINDTCGSLQTIYLVVRIIPTLVEEGLLDRGNTALQNYPNPFSGTTNVEFRIPNEELVTLNVYNALGEKVATLIHGRQSASAHTAAFDASGLPAGVYFYRLAAGRDLRTGTMMVVR